MDPTDSKNELVEMISEKVREVPGMAFEFTQPIKMRFDEMMTGVRSDIAVIIFGPNMDSLAAAGEQVSRLIRDESGVADLKVEQVEGLPQIAVVYDYQRLARYGLQLDALARIQTEAGEAKAAQQTLREMTRIAEFDADAQIRIGYLQLSAGNTAGARYSAEKALGGRPGDLRAMALGAEAALAEGDLQAAGKLASALARIAPDSALAHALARDVALAAGQHRVAAQAFRAALRIEPTGGVVLGLVRALLQDDRQSARKVLEDWLRKNAQDVPAQKALAELHMREGDWHAAYRFLTSWA